MAKKKTFLQDNPALQFISTADTEAEELEAAATKPLKAPEGYKLNPMFIEKKTKRLQLVLQPSLYEKVKSRADKAGLSVNEYIHQTLAEATREE